MSVLSKYLSNNYFSELQSSVECYRCLQVIELNSEILNYMRLQRKIHFNVNIS